MDSVPYKQKPNRRLSGCRGLRGFQTQHPRRVASPAPWSRKPKSMAALTTLMTRFCAGEDSWLARSNNISKNHGTSDTKDGNSRSRRNKHKRRINSDNTEYTAVNGGFKDSNPVSGKSHSNKVRRVLPAWTVYSIARVKYTAPQTSQPITPTGIVGCSSRPAS